MLTVESLSLSIGSKQILSAIDLVVEDGQHLLVCGRSGAGKSSLLRVAGALQRPTTGAIHIGKTSVWNLDRRELDGLRRSIGVIHQDPMLLDELTVFENVVWLARLRGFNTSAAAAESVAALHDLGLREFEDRRISTLSGGEAQRVSIARALVGSPSLVIADEPTSALDKGNSDRVARDLTEAAQRRSIPILSASHDPIMENAASDAIEIEDGRLEAEA